MRDSNPRMAESKSAALPLGESPEYLSFKKINKEIPENFIFLARALYGLFKNVKKMCNYTNILLSI